MKRIMVLLIVILLLSSISFGITNQEKAEALKEMGILKGTDQGLQLDEEFTRAQGAVMLVRMLGAVDQLEEKEYNHPFQDVPEWASNHIGYLYQNGLANGISDHEYGSNQRMRPNDYLTFVLRALNYDDSKGDFNWSNAVDKAEDLNIIDSEMKEKYKDGEFLREDMADVTYNSLNSNMKDSNQLLVEILNQETSISNDLDVITSTDNSISNTNTISNINNSDITISTDNSDNSANNSNNTVYDYSTTINNNIDNSTTVNNNNQNLEAILEELKKLNNQREDDSGILISLKITDNKTDEPIEDVEIYLNKKSIGKTNADGLIEINLYKYAQYIFKIEHDNYFNITYIDSYNDSKIIEKKLSSNENNELVKLGEEEIDLVPLESEVVDGRLRDIINFEFNNDSLVLGKWVAVDFVDKPTNYDVENSLFDDNSFIQQLEFTETNNESSKYKDVFFEFKNGFKPNHVWTKGVIIDIDGDDFNTASRYFIAEISGVERLFMEWKSGDYVYSHNIPEWYVFKRQNNNQ